MPRFEVQLPREGAQPQVQRVVAKNWLEALKKALKLLDEPPVTEELELDLRPDHSVIIFDQSTERSFKVRSLLSFTRPPPIPLEPLDSLELDDPYAVFEKPQPIRALPSLPEKEPERRDALEFELAALDEPSLKLSEAVALVLSTILRHVPSSAGGVHLIDPESCTLYPYALQGRCEGLAIRLPLGLGLLGTCLREGLPLNLPEPAEDPRYRGDPQRAPRALLCAPIRQGTLSFGVLELRDPLKRESFSPIDERFARRGAESLGRFLIQRLDGSKDQLTPSI